MPLLKLEMEFVTRRRISQYFSVYTISSILRHPCAFFGSIDSTGLILNPRLMFKCQSIYAASVIALVELQRSLVDDIGESGSSEHVLDNQLQGREPKNSFTAGTAVTEVLIRKANEESRSERYSQSV